MCRPENVRWRRLLAAAFVTVTWPGVMAAQEPPAVKPQEVQPGQQPPDEKKPTPAPAAPAGEEQKGDQKQDPDLEELRRRIDLLAAELEQLRSGEETKATLTDEQRRALGLGPSAAAVYERRPGVSLAGYGEMLFENYDSHNESGAGPGPGSRIDFLRAIIYMGYRFNDKFVFNSEIEVEHAREIWVEFAYLDYQINEYVALRGGMLLVPLGLVNEFHEPNVFIGARRPLVEQRIIPSTWRENGFGAVGSAGRVSYRAYVVNGLNAAGFTPDGLRGGRQRGAEARAADWGFAGRVDASLIPGVFVGAGLYHGGSDQDQYTAVDVGTTIVEVHGQAQVRGFDIRGLYAHARLDDVGALNRARNLVGSAGIGERQNGGYAQVAYNVLSQYGARVALAPYYRFEQLDTHAEVPAGFVRDRARDTRLHTVGLELKPISNIVVKADYQWITNQVRTGRNQFNVALGYAF